MGNLTPGQSYDHLCDPVSGFDSMHDLQFAAVPDDTSFTNMNIFRGSLCHVGDTGQLQAGFNSVSACRMPLFAINNIADFDVSSDEGNISGAQARQDSQLLGGLACFVATGGFEIATTEFDTTQTYTSGNTLISHRPSAATTDEYGWLTVGSAGSSFDAAIGETIVGIVSVGVRTETYDQSVLQFWPVFLPARD